MNWSRESDTNLISDCGRYSIARVNFQDHIAYEVWFKDSGKWRMISSADSSTSLLTRTAILRDIQQTCQDHADAITRNADRPADTQGV